MTEETNEFWWWANGDGKLKTVDQSELEQALSRGAIAPRTLVWKSGWAEWVRAAQVPELQPALPRHLVSSPIHPKLDPEATHPPPVPRDAGAPAQGPIIPVASSPENDKPRTVVLVESEVAAQELQPLRADPPPPPSRQNGVNGMNGSNGSGKGTMPPIIPVDSNPQNDRPDTGILADSEIVFEDEPPRDKWSEVQRKSAPPPPSARAPQPHKPAPVIGVKSEPSAPPRPEPTQPVAAPAPPTPQPAPPATPAPAAAAAAALAGRAGTAGGAPPPAAGSLGSLGKQTLIGMAPAAPLPNAPTLRGMAPQAGATPAPPAPAAAPPAAVAAAPAPAPAAAPAAPAPMAPVAPLARTALMPQTQAQPPIPVATVQYPPIVPQADPENEGPTVAMDPIVPVSEPENEAPTRIHPAALRDNAPLPAFDLDADGTAERAPQWQAPMQQQHQQAWAPPPKKSKLPLLIGVFLLLGLFGAAAAGVALYILKPWEKAETPKPAATAAAPAVETPAAPPTSTAACTLHAKGQKVAASAVVSVPVAVATTPDGSLIAVGFADSSTGATGITIDAKSLAAKEPFSRAGTKNVVGVVPLVASGALSFEVDRQGGELTAQRTVDAKQPFVIGQSPEGFARVVQNGRPEAIWADAAGEKTTEPRVASVTGQGHVVTFRRGSEIRVGWLNADGTKKTGLSTVSAGAARVGTPNIAANDQGVLVSFAARESDSAPWGVQLASAKPGALPTKAQAFSLPSGGPGGEAISPTAAALSGGRWLLQWTEGKAGSRVVRAQTLGADLAPLGDAFTLSPQGVEAGQGAVGVAGEHAVATYLVKSASGYELWASSLACK